MEKFLLSFFESNSSLTNYFHDRIAPRPIRERRANAGVCAIDDDPFSPQQNLRNYGYSIVSIGDLKSVDEVASFDVILCDLMGVGLHFDNRLQGVSIIGEIKKTFPEKYVVAYTSAAMNAAIARQAISLADDTIRKDTDIEDWVKILDEYTDRVQNPHVVWDRIRLNLVNRGISTKDIFVLESSYVKSIIGKDSTFSALKSASTKLKLNEDVRAIINGMISSIAFKFVFGV